MLTRKAVPFLLTVLLVTAVISPVLRAKNEKLKPEELVAKHLQSIGPAERLRAIKSRTTQGSVQVFFRVGGSGTYTGKSNILSEGNMIRSGFKYPVLDYPGEQLAFDGNKVTAGQMSPGNYPPIVSFVYENDVLLKEGLLYGSLTTAWALLDTESRKPRLEATGLKKIDGRQLQELKYVGRNWKSGMEISLYFDPETYRHVRSQFKSDVALTKLNTIFESEEKVRYQIVEQFDQFKSFDGITLPQSHKIEFTLDSPRGTVVTLWTHMIERIVHNEAIERQLFTVQ